MTSTSFSAEHQPSRRKASAPDGAAAERQLARWIAEGDDEALAELVELVGPTLYGVALGISEDARHAEGAVEETFAELWEKRAGLGRLPALSPWLLERCRSWAIALRSDAAAAAARSLQERAGDIPLTRRLLRCPPELRTLRVNAALDQLDTRQRQTVVLGSRAGLEVAEIGRRLGIESNEVHALMRQGLQTIRGGLERTLRREPI